MEDRLEPLGDWVRSGEAVRGLRLTTVMAASSVVTSKCAVRVNILLQVRK